MIFSIPRNLNPSARTQAGFTVVELLVSLVILALILSFLPGTLRVGQRVWERQKDFEQAAAFSAFHHYVGQRLSEAMPIFERDHDGKISMVFDGGPSTLRFVARAHAGPAGGGIYQFELTRNTTARARSRALVLKQQIYRTAHDGEATTKAAVHTTPGRIGKLSLRYFGKPARDQPPKWQTRWTRPDALPDLVEITVLTRDPKPIEKRRIVELKLRAR